MIHGIFLLLEGVERILFRKDLTSFYGKKYIKLFVCLVIFYELPVWLVREIVDYREAI